MKWKERNTFQKVTMIIIWIMLIITILGVVLATVGALISN